jgi:hypothetical protein
MLMGIKRWIVSLQHGVHGITTITMSIDLSAIGSMRRESYMGD